MNNPTEITDTTELKESSKSKEITKLKKLIKLKEIRESYYEKMINYLCSFTFPYNIYSRSLDIYHRYLSKNADANLSQITKHIYIGNLSAAYNTHLLKEKRIEYIVTAIWNMPRINEFVYTMQIDIIDVPQNNITQYFEQCNTFLDLAINQQQNVFLHCICGVSRSVTLLIAYFIYKYRISPKIALDYIQTKRPIANPNKGFMKQLDSYYQEILRYECQDDNSNPMMENENENEIISYENLCPLLFNNL